MPSAEELPYCDLVMKGGITSGIAYPPALEELSRGYRFNSIGGTSVGAIAAAGAAAAEFARQRGTGKGGFKTLMDMSTWLGVEGHLFSLFDAPKETRAIITLVKSIGAFGGETKSTQSTPVRFMSAIPKATPLHFIMGLIAGGLIGLALATLIAPGLASSITVSDSELQWLVPSVLVTGALALVSALVVWLAREAIQNVANMVIRVLLVAAALGAFFSIVVPWLLTLALNPIAPGWFNNPIFAVGLLFSLLMGYIGGSLAGVYHLIFGVLLKAVPRNYYGIINGHDPAKDEQKDGHGRPVKPTNATDWLSVQLDKIAGLGNSNSPLTFGDLCNHGITLKMISTNVSLGLPFELPFTKNIFIFNECEMRKLFPDYVVGHMVEKSRGVKRSSPDEPFIPIESLPDGYCYVPQAEDFPVVVAMRMSLALPILLSAIPFYSVSVSAYARVSKAGGKLNPYQGKEKGKNFENDLLLNYFGDGGTCANFPIHFFDKWLPTRPTFGINLTAMPPDAIDEDDTIDKDKESVKPSYFSALRAVEKEDMGDNGARGDQKHGRRVPVVELPRAGTVLNPEYRPVSNPLDFIMKTVDTARENHDNQQAMLPGYSERIIQVRFKDGEGGMNLAMSEKTIEAIIGKGKRAGKELRCNFDFEEHRWTRFRVLMSHLETELEKMHVAFNNGDLKPTYSQLINPAGMIEEAKRDGDCEREEVKLSPETGRDLNYPFERDPDWRAESVQLANELLAVIEAWKKRQQEKPGTITNRVGDNTSGQQPDEGKCEIGKCDPMRTEPQLKHFSENSPEPKSALRVTPPI